MSTSMNHAFNIAKTGLQLQELHLAVKSQNIASQGVDTFKRQYLVSSDLPYQDFGNVGVRTSDNNTISPTGLQVGTGVQAGSIYRVWTQGDPTNTGRSLDVLIDGEGFFQVAMPDGTTAYTRVGAWERDFNNTLVMPKTGYSILPGITLPTDTMSVSINQFGQVYVETTPGQEQLVGQIEMATFFNPSGLKAIGDSMFVETPASGTPDKGTAGTNRRGTVKQGWREGSNVNSVEEMTSLIQIQRIYEMLVNVVKTGDAMMAATTKMS
jgi:flagellar basal-body rod protein FlgG